MCIGNISKDFSYSNIKRTGLYGYVYDLGGDFDAIAVDDILDIYKYLMKKNGIVWNISIYKNCIFYCNDSF